MKNQIMTPATQFLELVIKNPTKMFDRFRVKAENKKKGQVDILKFVKRTKNLQILMSYLLLKKKLM